MPDATPEEQTCPICASLQASKFINEHRAHLINQLNAAAAGAAKSLDAKLQSHVVFLALNFAHLLVTQPIHVHVNGAVNFGDLSKEQIKSMLGTMLKSMDEPDPRRN